MLLSLLFSQPNKQVEDQKDDSAIKVICVNCGICLEKSVMQNHEHECSGGGRYRLQNYLQILLVIIVTTTTMIIITTFVITEM